MASCLILVAMSARLLAMLVLVVQLRITKAISTDGAHVLTIAANHGTGSSTMSKLVSRIECVVDGSELFSPRERFLGESGFFSLSDGTRQDHGPSCGHEDPLRVDYINECKHVERIKRGIEDMFKKSNSDYTEAIEMDVTHQIRFVLANTTSGNFNEFVMKLRNTACRSLARYDAFPRGCDEQTCVLAHKFFPIYVSDDHDAIISALTRSAAVIQLDRDGTARQFSNWRRFSLKCADPILKRALESDAAARDLVRCTNASLYGSCAFAFNEKGEFFEDYYTEARQRRGLYLEASWYRIHFEEIYAQNETARCAHQQGVARYIGNFTAAPVTTNHSCIGGSLVR